MTEDQSLGVERVILDPLRFKQRLHIGEDAYAVLKAKKALSSIWSASPAGLAGAGVAQSSIVASTFFAPAAPAGLLGWLGLGAPAVAVTPLGWVIAAGLLASGGYLGVTRWLASGPDRFVDTIPKHINTPLDLLGTGLFEGMAPLALRVAEADGHVADSERETISAHLVQDWGYDPGYVAAALTAQEQRSDRARLSVLAAALATFQARNPDCNASAMQTELMEFLRELVAADGVIDWREERALRTVELALAAHHATVSRHTQRYWRSLGKIARSDARSDYGWLRTSVSAGDTARG